MASNIKRRRHNRIAMKLATMYKIPYWKVYKFYKSVKEDIAATKQLINLELFKTNSNV